MTAANSPHLQIDILARLEYWRRVDELKELAESEGLRLPMPAEWISTLEAIGIAVDLCTGSWRDADSVCYMLTPKARAALKDGAP